MTIERVQRGDVQRDEVWNQGSQPGDPPISSVVVPVSLEAIEYQEALDTLQTYTSGELGNPRLDELITALFKVLGVTEQDPTIQQRTATGRIQSLINRLTRRG